ncbi:MAG TPA: uracil-DNA glycosylase family protein [Bdellovibrionota bacterium]|jgi:single-strand selective monofunctional uracil DNA glycosylase|nr:uracil-DNA glycosylase family protein [Bdellovibrionota bacterium]
MKNFPSFKKKSLEFSRALGDLKFSAPVTHVYNPLDYASEVYFEYWRRYASAPKSIVFLGMNPGPFGMAQTGIPFGEVSMVRDWMGLEGMVKKPEREHPKRPVLGFACPRSEVSGRRLWGLFAETYPRAEDFFAKHFVLNYCPLVFMAASGANLTPDKIKVATRHRLETLCDEYLQSCLEFLQPQQTVGVGAFAHDKLLRMQGRSDSMEFGVTKIIHPSPASPAANHGWAQKVRQSLRRDGLKL